VNYRVLPGALVHLGDECNETQAGELVFANSLRLVWTDFFAVEKRWRLHFVIGFALTLRRTLAD
jgi:hypothetical protein